MNGFSFLKFIKGPWELMVFLRNVSITMAATFYTAFCFFLIKVIAARSIGPLEYGKFLLVLSTGQILMIPLLLGLNYSVVKNYTHKEGKNKIGPYYIVFLVSSVIWLSLYFIFKDRLVILLKLPFDIFLFSIFYAVILGLKLLSEGALKAQRKFKLSAIIDVGTTTFFVLSAVLLFIFGPKSYLLLVYPVFFAYFVYTLAVGVKNLKQFGIVKERVFYKDVIRYGFWAMLIFAVYILFLNSDKLIINYFFNEAVVGVFGAHLVAASALWIQACTTFVSVFFPTIVNIREKQKINKKLNRLAWKLVLPYFFFVYIFALLVMRLFGAKYPLNNFLLVLMSLNVVLFSLVQVKNWLLASRSIKDIKHTSFYWLGAYFVYIGLIFSLISFFSFYVIVLSAILVNIVILVVFERRLAVSKEPIN